MSFLQNTLDVLKESSKIDLSLFVLEQLIKGGVPLNGDEFVFSEVGIFMPMPNNSIIKVVAYEARKDEKAFKQSGFPYYHILNCSQISHMAREGDIKNYVACFKTENRFYFSVMHKNIETKFYNDKPLEMCPLCLTKLNALYQKEFTQTNFDLAIFLRDAIFKDSDDFKGCFANRTFRSEIWTQIIKKIKSAKTCYCISCNKELGSDFLGEYESFIKYGMRFERPHFLCSDCKRRGK